MLDDPIYWIVVVAGGVTLFLEAFRNFNTYDGNHPFDLHPILQEVEPKDLCTDGEIIAGFVYYFLIYVVLYVAILGSAEIYGLVLHATHAQTQIGAVASPEDFPFISNASSPIDTASGYGKPIFVSALIISFLSLGPVKPVEKIMRSFAHRMAGIPKGVYRVIENLLAVPYESYENRIPTPLTKKFEECTANLPNNYVLQAQTRSIKSSILAIDCLSVSLKSSNRMLYFPLIKIAQFNKLLIRLEEEHSEIYEQITKISPDDGESKIQQTLNDLSQKVTIARSNTFALFAVIYVRNNRSIARIPQTSRTGPKNTNTPQDVIEDIKNIIQEDYNAEQNSFAFSLILSAILAFLISLLVYNIWISWLTQSALCLEAGITATENCLEQLSTLLENATASFGTRMDELRDIVNRKTLWDTLRSMAIVLSSVWFALIAREARIEQNYWKTNWQIHQFPFLRLLGLSIFSGLIAVFACALTELLNLAVSVNFELRQTQITFLFQQNGTFFLLHFGSGVILAFGTLVIMDKHDQLHAFWTFSIGLLFSALYFSYTYFLITTTYGSTLPTAPILASFSQIFRDTIILSVLPSLFLPVFGITLEMTENPIARKEIQPTNKSQNSPSPKKIGKTK